jgi:ABC-type multidrug transport system permease subunit
VRLAIKFFKISLFIFSFFSIAFLNSLCFTSVSIAQNRLGGIWNRTILSGVSPLEILLVQIIISFFVVFISLIEIFLIAYYIIDITIIGSAFALICILFLVNTTGAFCGILLSTIADDIKIVSTSSLAFGQIIMNICGAMWPLEAQHWMLRYFSFMTPITLPAISIRDVMIKGFALSAPSVMIGISILLAWICLTLTLSFFVLKNRKFCEKSF